MRGGGREAFIRDAMRGGIFGAGAGLVFAKCGGNKNFGASMAIGALLGSLGASCLRARSTDDEGEFFAGFSPPPHPIEVMPNFDPRGHVQDRARAVLYDFYHDNDLRSWADDGDVKKAFGVKQKEDHDPSQLAMAYADKNSHVWRGSRGRMNWPEMDRLVKAAINKRTRLGKLPKACYDKDPIIIYYYDDHLMKKVEYARSGLQNMLNPGNHYYWRDPSVHTYQTDKPAVIADEQQHPCRKGHNGWDDEGFDWDKDAVGQVSQIVQTTLQLVGLAMQATGYAAAVGSAISQASPYIGTLTGMVDDAFQGNDNSKAVAAIAKIILEVANKGLGEAAGFELPPAAMKVLGEGVDGIGQQIAAAQQEHLDYTGIWTKILEKAKTFPKIGDVEAHTIGKILGENSAGATFIKGYQAGKLADLPTIDAISKMFNNQGNANVWMLGAGLGQLSVHQGTTAPVHKAALPLATSAPHAASGGYWPLAEEFAYYWE